MTNDISIIPKEWKSTTLGTVAEIQTGPFGSQLHNEDYVINGTPIITVENLIDNSIEYTNRTPKVSDLDKNRLQKYILKKGDIVFSRVGSVDRCGFVSEKENGWLFSGRLLRVRPQKELLDKYVFYWLTQESIKKFVRKIAVGATMPSINTGLLSQIPIFIPTLEEQHLIADVLTSIDSKIELFREQKKTLEATAQAIFNEWFVKFNFPGSTGKIIDSELGKIPEGWRIGKLGDQIEIFDSKRIPLASDVRAKRKGKYPYYGATSIMDYIDDYLFDGTYLLLAEDGSVIDENGYPVMQYVWGRFWVSNHSHVLQGKNGFSTEILYLFMKKANITGIVNGAVQLKINKANLIHYELIIPAAEILQKYDRLLQPIFVKIKIIEHQIKTLSYFRDALLPKLMKGELRVKRLSNTVI